MKKKFLAIVAVVVAFVMSLALIACGNPGESGDNNSTTSKKSPAERAVGAVSEMLSKNGVSGTLDVDLAMSGADAIKVSGAFVKSGSRVKLTVEDEVSILDLSTGYVYMLENGVAVNYDAALPAGLYDYISDMFDKYTDGAQVSADMWEQADEIVTYDAATRTVTYHTDVAEQINDLTYNLYEAYKGDKTVTWLLDAYLLDLSDGLIRFSPVNVFDPDQTFDSELSGLSIVDMITGFALIFPDKTVGSVMDSLKTQYGLDIEAMLAEQGIDVVELLKGYGIETTVAALKARTIEDIIVGAYKAMSQAMQPEPPQPDVPQPADEFDDESESVIGGGMEQMLPVILEGAVNGVKEEGDPSAAEIVDGLFKQLIMITDNAHVKALIDEMLGSTNPELVAAIAAGVQIKELSFQTVVKLDENDNLDSLSVTCVFEHDYNGTVEESFTVLASNKYSVNVKLDVTAYTDSPEAITFTYGDMSKLEHFNLADAIVVGDTVTEDVKVFVELGGRQNLQNVTVTFGACEYVWSDVFYDYVPSVAPNANITYDKATSVVTIKAAYLNEYFANAEQGSPFVVCMSAEVQNGENSALYVYTFNVILLSDNIDELPSLPGGILG